MKIFISLSAANHPHKKGDRVIVKAGTNEWYIGTVVRAGAKIKIDFDDGNEALVEEPDFKDVRALVKPKKLKRALTNAEAKELYTVPKEVKTRAPAKQKEVPVTRKTRTPATSPAKVGSDPQAVVQRLVESADPATEFYQWQRNKQGGQQFGNQSIVTPLTEELLQAFVWPLSKPEAMLSLPNYRKKFPKITHIGLERRHGKDWQMWREGSKDACGPRPSNPGWVKRVKSLDSPAALKFGKSADDESGPEIAKTTSTRPPSDAKSRKESIVDQMAAYLTTMLDTLRGVRGMGASTAPHKQLLRDLRTADPANLAPDLVSRMRGVALDMLKGGVKTELAKDWIKVLGRK